MFRVAQLLDASSPEVGSMNASPQLWRIVLVAVFAGVVRGAPNKVTHHDVMLASVDFHDWLSFALQACIAVHPLLFIKSAFKQSCRPFCDVLA